MNGVLKHQGRLERSPQAAVVNISSVAGIAGQGSSIAYCASKGALNTMTKSLARALAPQIRVNAVCPGSTLTEFHVQRAGRAGKSVQQLRGERKDTSLLGRWADPQEIAYPILWLASDEASFITGTTLMVDGGLHIM